MRKRSVQIFALALLIGAALWALSFAHNGGTDEARYLQWHDSWARLIFLERHLPASVYRALHLATLEQRYRSRDEEIVEVLVTSGYLTNVHISVTNAGACRAQNTDQLRRATQGNHAKWEFYVRSNAIVVLTCRPQDVSLCAGAVEGK
jgi:hypothetical protein